MKNVTIWELVWELISAGVKVEEVAKRLGKHRATIYRWQKGTRHRGVRRFVKEKKEAKRKRGRRSLDAVTVRLIKKRKEHHSDWCGEKIVWELRTKYKIKISRASVYRVLNRYYQLRSGWKKNQARRPQPKAQRPRDVIQADMLI